MVERVHEYKELREVLISHSLSLGQASDRAFKAVYGILLTSPNEDSDSQKDNQKEEPLCDQKESLEECPDREWLKHQLLLTREQLSATTRLQIS